MSSHKHNKTTSAKAKPQKRTYAKILYSNQITKTNRENRKRELGQMLHLFCMLLTVLFSYSSELVHLNWITLDMISMAMRLRLEWISTSSLAFIQNEMNMNEANFIEFFFLCL